MDKKDEGDPVMAAMRPIVDPIFPDGHSLAKANRFGWYSKYWRYFADIYNWSLPRHVQFKRVQEATDVNHNFMTVCPGQSMKVTAIVEKMKRAGITVHSDFDEEELIELCSLHQHVSVGWMRGLREVPSEHLDVSPFRVISREMTVVSLPAYLIAQHLVWLERRCLFDSFRATLCVGYSKSGDHPVVHCSSSSLVIRRGGLGYSSEWVGPRTVQLAYAPEQHKKRMSISGKIPLANVRDGIPDRRLSR